MSYIISNNELENCLIEKYESLINSCKFFDEGKTFEAREISVKLRFLLHDTEKSTSLLEHIGEKQKIKFWDSGNDYDPNNLIPLTALVGFSYNNKWNDKYVPKFSRNNERKKVDFESWWNKIIISDKNNIFSRKDIVLEIAHKDGGAHINKDKKLSDKYFAISRLNSTGWRIEHDEGAEELRELHYSSIRQIAHEVLVSLGKEFSYLNSQCELYEEYINTLE